MATMPSPYMTSRGLLAVMGVLLIAQAVVVVGWSDGPLNVHIVPHSHNDPGWWKTFEGYYQDWTKGILSSVVEILSESPTRTFIWAEISYFQRWWEDQSDDVKSQVKKLVKNSQLEFVTAGWVMNDEANTHVVDIINQLTEGHEWLYKTLHTKPKYGWAIDPFGHSPTMPYVLQQMGFEAMVINRAHREIKQEFRDKKLLEFMWSGDRLNSSSSFNIFTHMLPWKLYDIPNTCGPDWYVCEKFDFERPEAIPITASNVKERAKILIDMYKAKAKLFRHNSVLIPLGDDFKYKNPDITRKMFTQYEMLIDAINKDTSLGVNIKFSTLRQYFEEVQAEFATSSSSKDSAGSDVAQLPPYQGDFFTYCDEKEDYWSGYFTTRPFMKGLTRSTQAILRSGEVLATLARSYAGKNLDQKQWSSWFDSIETARRNVALFQHHDGVTGTARRAVVEDYANRLLTSLAQVAEHASDMALVVLSKAAGEHKADKLSWITEPAKRISLATPRIIKIEKNGAVLVVFNSLTHLRSEVVSVLVDTHELEVTDYEGKKVVAQVDPVWDGNSFSSTQFTLHFVANVPGIGIATYFVRLARHATLSKVVVYSPKAGSDDTIVGDWNNENKALDGTNAIVVENSLYRATLNGFGTVKEITRTEATGGIGGLSSDINQEFLEYSSSGGAYLFLPAGSASPLTLSTERVYIAKGPIVQTVHSFHQSSVRELIVRLYECNPSSTQHDVVSPCPQSQGVELVHMVDLNKGDTELVTRFKTDIANDGRFYTDSNGFEMRERNYAKKLPIQGNYYPITAATYIESSSVPLSRSSSSSRFTVLSHQAHGVTSLSEGELEVMLDRRLNRDDARGLGEPVMDNVRTRIPLWLVVEAGASVNSFAHPALSSAASEVWHACNYPLHTLYSQPQSQASMSLQDSWKSSHYLRLDPLSATIAKELQILSLAPRDKESNGVILRVFHPPVQVDMSTIASTKTLVPGPSPAWSFDNAFNHFTVTKPIETSLSLLYEKRKSDQVDTVDPTTIKTWIIQLDRSEAHTRDDTITHPTEAPTKSSLKHNTQAGSKDNTQDDTKKEANWKPKETETPVDDLFVEKVKADTPLHENDDEPVAADDTEVIVPETNDNKETTKEYTNNKTPNQGDLDNQKDDVNHKEDRRDYGNEKSNALGNPIIDKDDNKDFPRPKEKLNRGIGEGRISKVKDEALQLKDQAIKVSNATGMYTMSIVIYLALLVIAVLGGWLLGRRRNQHQHALRSDSSSSTARTPSVWQDREDSLMKLL